MGARTVPASARRPTRGRTATSSPALIVHGGAGRWSADEAALAAAGCVRAATAGWAVLDRGGTALDAVLAAVTCLEDDPLFNAGVGSCLTADGMVEMDASVMDGRRRFGAGVALVTTVRNPVQLARVLVDNARHVLLAGAGAEAFARARGLATAPRAAFVTERQRRRWERARPESRGTVGAAAVDRDGHVAAATSTGGMAGKLPGRIGDSAVIGAGTYADDRAGAASATGDGEAIILAGLSRAAVARLRERRHPVRVAAEVVRELGRAGAVGGIVLVDRFGRIGSAHNAACMPTAVRGTAA